MKAESSHLSEEHLSLLYQVSQTFNSSLDLDVVLNQVMDEVISAISAERGFVVLRAANNAIQFRAARGIDSQSIDSPQLEVSHGLIEKVLNEGKPILTLDAQKEEWLGARQSVMNLNLLAVLCAPLKTKHETIGAIYLDNRLKSGAFSEAALDLLVAIAGLAAMAIENARLFRETQSNLETLHLLHDISADLTSTLNIQQVLTGCLNRVQDLLGTATGSILTVDGDELVFQIAIGEKSEEIKPFRLPRDQGIAGWVVENAQGLIVNDVRKDARFYADADAETGFITQDLMAAPLISNERTIGVIEVSNKPGGFTDADLDLLTTIAGSAAIALENARLFEVAVEKGRLERELQMARKVQSSLIPDDIPKFSGYEFAAKWLPAREVAGDYYDFIPADEGKLGLLIADVTDKGMPAALFMAFSRSIVRANVTQAATPADGITKANQLICADSTSGMPVTLFYALLDQDSGNITYVNAGHNPPLLFRVGKTKLVELTRTGMFVGFEEEASFEQKSVKLAPGDFLVLYTDGVCDAINSEGQDFGEKRLRKVVRKNSSSSAQEIVAAVQKGIDDFTGDITPFDDITILVVKKK
ncbi:MAG: SpoIIE family protein phosphatase [Chloroflexi bacterium]|nr:SpoIIE family protein phosphatase [Chloroflexota bacterium]